MFGQFILQSVLVLQRDSVPAIAALHPVNGFLILLIAIWLATDAWRRFQADGSRCRPRRRRPRSRPAERQAGAGRPRMTPLTEPESSYASA